MRRRNRSTFIVVMSSSSITMLPVSVSMSRLIIFKVVVLPQPEGPTSMTMLPAGIYMVRQSTAGTAWPGNALVISRSRIETPWEAAVGAARSFCRSDTEPSRCGEPADADEDEIEQQGEEDDADHANDHGLQRVHSPYPG